MACSSSMGASSTGGIFIDGLPFLPCCASYRLWRLAAVPPLPFSGLARARDAWLPPTVASADVSPRSSRFAKSCAALSAGRRAATGGEKQIPQAWGGLQSAPRRPREEICFQPQRQMLPQSAGVERHSTSLAVLLVARGCHG